MKKLLTGILILFVLCSAAFVWADDFIITGAPVTVDAHAEGFTSEDEWTLAYAGTTLTSSESSITIDDLSGTNSGWIFTLNFTDFTVSGISDPSVDAATVSLNVDVEDLLTITLKDSADTAITTGDIPATDGTDIVAANYTVDNTIAGSGNLAVLEIEPGYGAGKFLFGIDYAITLDDWLTDGTTITSTTDSGIFASSSPVTVDNDTQKYQVLPGTYSITITYSVAANPA